MKEGPSKGASVLATLTQTVMNEKKAEARKLTPVIGEALPVTTASFPNDMPGEVVLQKVAELDRIIKQLTEARDALADLGGANDNVAPPDPLEQQKAKEAAADSKFAEGFKAQQAEAQAAVFKGESSPAPAEGENSAAGSDWACPTHGKAAEKVSPKTGKTYIGCPECNQFKR